MLSSRMLRPFENVVGERELLYSIQSEETRVCKDDRDGFADSKWRVKRNFNNPLAMSCGIRRNGVFIEKLRDLVSNAPCRGPLTLRSKSVLTLFEIQRLHM